MKKFSILLVGILFVICGILTGCAGFSVDRVKYFNEVLATVGEVEITRFDLLNAYSSYGKSYYKNQLGQEEDEALASTLDLLIDRQALCLYAKNCKEVNYKPTPYQINEIIKKMYDSLDNQTEMFASDAEIMLGISPLVSKEEQEKQENDETAFIYKPYEKRAYIEWDGDSNTYKLKYNTDNSENNAPVYAVNPIISEELLTAYEKQNPNYSLTIEAIKNTYLNHLKQNLEHVYGNKKDIMFNKIIALYTNNLMGYEYYLRDENGKEFSKSTNDLLFRNIERSFCSAVEDQYITNLENHFLNNEELDLNSLITTYNNLQLKDKIVYGLDPNGYASTIKEISTNGDSIIYHPTLEDRDFGYFVHMLISFDDIKEQLEALDSYSEEYKDLKDAEKENIIKSITITPRGSDGLKTGSPVSISTVMEEYSNILNQTNYLVRLQMFNAFMYKYSADPGLLSGGMPYVVGTKDSAMVEAFNEEAIALMKGETGVATAGGYLGDVNAGRMSNWNSDMYYRDLCISEHGIHLIMYVGNVNMTDSKGREITISLDENTEKFNLYTEYVNILTKQTYFDKMFDVVYPANNGGNYSSNTGYYNYEKIYCEIGKKQNPVVKYTDRINNTYETI